MGAILQINKIKQSGKRVTQGPFVSNSLQIGPLVFDDNGVFVVVVLSVPDRGCYKS